MKGKINLPPAIEQQAAFWLPVCPVHLIADRDTLVLAPTSGLGLSLPEAQGLVEAFNGHFAEDGYCLYAVSERDWFLGSEQQWKLNFPSLEQAESMNCRDAWQRGKDAGKWRKLLNELQMLWFSDSVNVQREQQGYLPINGLWVMQQKSWWQKWFE
ncbi:MAG: hypothetical protein IE928_02585 [Gammaproteobacteria bacterium]|nr:hypothetical protein [Gammaproteobacteria bacterium]